MGRKPRIYFEGAIYHVTVRGNNKEDIFFDAIDRLKYLKIAREYKHKNNFIIYAYVLMPNHIHVVIEPSNKANISNIMHYINSNYAKYVSWKYKKVGHIFQGRFYSNIIEKDFYLLNVIRYIHFNPVRANLVKAPEQWKWSSLHHYLNKRKDELDVETSFVLRMLSVNKEEQLKLFKEFLSLPQEEDNKLLKNKLTTSFFIGSDNYINKMNEAFGIVKKKKGRPKMVPGTIF